MMLKSIFSISLPFLLLLVLTTNRIVLTSTNGIPLDLMEKWLKEPLKYLQHLQLIIRYNSFSRDIENPYIQWFLRHVDIPKTLTTYYIDYIVEPRAAPSSGNGGNNDNYVIITDMVHLRASAQQFCSGFGVFFFIVEGALNMTKLHHHFYAMFYEYSIFPNFLLTDEAVLAYDPFALNANGEYGQIIEYTGDEDLKQMVFSDMRGFPLRALLFKSVYSRPVLDAVTKKMTRVDGVDGRVAHLLQERLNFTLELQDPDPHYFGGRLPNGSYNGALGSILDKKVDICLTGFFVKDYLTRNISFSVAMYDDQLCIYTRKAERVPGYILPILAINSNLWIGFISTAFIASLVWAMLRSLTLYLKIYDIQLRDNLRQPLKWQYLTILKDTWMVWVRVCLNQYPLFESEKVFLASLCLVSVIFGAIFECSLASSHIKPLYFKDVNTLQELDSSGIPIIYRHISMGHDLFASETSPLFASLHNKTVHKPDRKYDVMEDIAENGGKAGVNRYNNLMLESLDVIVTKKIWIIPEFPKRYRISYVWLKDAPWEETVNNLLLQFLQVGVIQKFEQEMKIDVDIQIIRDRLYESNQGFKILTIDDLQLAFYVVIIGSLMGALTWTIEKLVPP